MYAAAAGIQYQLKSGEHLRVVAAYFGFGSLEPITQHPDNQALLSERGGVDGLRGGDIVTIPEGTAGKKDLAPGRGHVLTVKRTPGTFLLIVEAGFRLTDPEAVGDIVHSPLRWKAFSGPLAVISASASLAQAGGGPIYSNVTDKKGRVAAPLLDDGDWTLQLDPELAALSRGPATADPAGGHWLEADGAASKPTPANKFYEAEYQPLKIKITVVAGVVESAEVTAPLPKDRPAPAVVFWKGLGERKASQILHVDWKPDFLRRVAPKLRPKQHARTATIDLIMVHQTAGTNIGSALNTFLPPAKKSGAHFLNDLDGHVVRLADDHCFTQHGGGYAKVRTPEYDGTNVNNRSIGIENVHADDSSHLDPAENPFTDAQYTSLISLLKALRAAYAVTPRQVIGHQDATPKARCPGPHLDWPRLEKAGVSLAPSPVSATEIEVMFGGFFAGADGKARSLKFGDAEELFESRIRIMRAGKSLVDGLQQRPIECITRALFAIGYTPAEKIFQGGGGIDHRRGDFDKSLAFCLSQFVRHYATGARIRSDQSAAYAEIALGKKDRHNKVSFDLELAKLLRGAELSAAAWPRATRRPIEVDP